MHTELASACRARKIITQNAISALTKRAHVHTTHAPRTDSSQGFWNFFFTNLKFSIVKVSITVFVYIF